VLAALTGACTHSSSSGWDPARAAAYLDRRATRWMAWGPAQLEQGTACMSCHTSLPYALSRMRLAPLLHESAQPAALRRVLANVRQRVAGGSTLSPYYYDENPGMAPASRGTESVLNALILADEDAAHGAMSPVTLAAFEALWAQQRTTGADAGSWDWTVFDNEPWEAADSVYYGATLAALALACTPESYRARPAVAARLALLRDYLLRNEPAQTLLNRLNLLRAAQRLPGLATPALMDAIRAQAWQAQRPDGGWSLGALLPASWSRHDGTLSPTGSDAFATAFAALIAEEGGTSVGDARLARALVWLKQHQSRWSGGWSSDSPNRSRRFWHDPSRFMSDAATAFAVLALTSPAGVRSGDGLAANR
jgi:squalene-hopene/tetraprenyl-beta-curcumene cyclase